jgi:site-specific DNA recombinase
VLEGRKGLLSLLEDAKRTPRPFDCVLIDDTSRLGRDLEDVLKLTRQFKHHGVFFYFVAQRLDTRKPFSKRLQVWFGMDDEEFLERLREKVHRGMKGAALNGHHTGGTRYGYRSVLEYDPVRKDEYGRPAVAYAYLKIDADEAQIIRTIFEMKAKGTSIIAITKHLNAQGVPAPRGAGWSITTIRHIIRNELYRGRYKWNTTRKERDSDSRKMRKRTRSREEWVEKEIPDLRIIPEELWNRVQEHNERMQKIGRQRLGGFNKTKASQGYLFSGLLACGLCKCAIGIVKSGKTPAIYGCRKHRFENRCTNTVTIRRDILEDQLLKAISQKVRPEVLEEGLKRLSTEISNYLKKELEGDTGPDMASQEKRLGELKSQQANLVRAIARYSDSEGLVAELAAVESAITEARNHISRLSKTGTGPLETLSYDQFRSFVTQKAGDLELALRSDPTIARETLRKVIRRLVLTPVQTSNGHMLEITGGDVDLFCVDPCVMLDQSVERYAKQYTGLLSLIGVMLDPKSPLESAASLPNVDNNAGPVTREFMNSRPPLLGDANGTRNENGTGY